MVLDHQGNQEEVTFLRQEELVMGREVEVEEEFIWSVDPR